MYTITQHRIPHSRISPPRSCSLDGINMEADMVVMKTRLASMLQVHISHANDKLTYFGRNN